VVDAVSPGDHLAQAGPSSGPLPSIAAKTQASELVHCGLTPHNIARPASTRAGHPT
jgi:hypothetical protein